VLTRMGKGKLTQKTLAKEEGRNARKPFFEAATGDGKEKPSNVGLLHYIEGRGLSTFSGIFTDVG